MRSGFPRQTEFAPWLLAALALSACQDGVEPVDEPLSAVQAEAVALFVSDVDATGGHNYGRSTDARSGTFEFSRSWDCPADGTHGVSGSGTKTLDGETRVLSTTWATTQTHDDCAVSRTRGDQQIMVVIDGTVTATGSATYQLPDEQGGERLILSFTSTRIGTTTTSARGRTRTCEIDLTETYDRESNAFTVTGSICGRDVDLTRTPGERCRG